MTSAQAKGAGSGAPYWITETPPLFTLPKSCHYVAKPGGDSSRLAETGVAGGHINFLNSIWPFGRTRSSATAPFSKRSQQTLARRSSYYRHLPESYRSEFHKQIQAFLADTPMTGIEVKVPDDLRLLVAASAVTLTVGWPGYKWTRVSEVLLYPDSFDRDYKFGERDYAGQTHQWGVVILSVPALMRSFKIPDEAYHVGLHEFAHLLDLTSGRFDGIPPYLTDDAIRQWEQLLAKEDERLRRGDSILDTYALTGPEEFFAVAVEAFFQTPADLTSHHGELYAFLAAYFRQDPAAWNS
jgi:MtfA peptidase